MRRVVAIICLLFFIPGCQESSRNIPSFYYDGWIVTDGIIVPDSRLQDAGLAPDGLKFDVNGPKIEIKYPKKPPDYVVGKTMTVIAKITDPDGVQAQSITANVKGLKAVKMSLSTMEDEFEAKIDISTLATNSYLWVVAIDSKGNKNTSLIPFRRDPGPMITILAPKADERAKSSVSINVVVNYDVVVANDEKLKVRVGSTDIAMTRKSHVKTPNKCPPGKEPGTCGFTGKQVWIGTVVFKDFEPPLTGNQMLTATMENTKGTIGTATRTFFVDNLGPTFNKVSHAAGEIIGGTIKVFAEITDDAGILDSSVKCVFGKSYTKRIIDLIQTATPGRYEALFDARLLGVHELYVVMDFLASDTLGNESHLGLTVILDNGPPVLEMDPPADLHMSKKDKTDINCSYPMDPVGSDAVNDLYQVPQVVPMRVRVEDQGNLVPSVGYHWISGIDSKKVILYVLDDTKQPLVVDSDGDGICDSINPNVIPLGSAPKVGQAVSVQMEGISPSGAADYYNKGTGILPPPCTAWGSATAAPLGNLCLGVPALVVPPARCVAASTVAIYTIPKITTTSTSYSCMGLPFDFLANKFDPGWACAAVAAQDKLGNRGVTPPMRVFVNYSSGDICSTAVDCPKGEICKELIVKGVTTKKCVFISQTSVLPATSEAKAPPTCLGTMDKKTGVVNPNKPCEFRNPRKGSNPTLKKYNCKSWQDYHRQMFCHNEVVCTM